MKAVRSLVAVVQAVVFLVAPAVVFADGRVALVVGNGTYAHIGRLPNPDNDAADMSAALQRLGFEVTTEFDADRVELTAALRAFTRRSAGADVSLVFYAGHGIEMDGVNYLVPVDARLERDVDVRFETVTVDDLLVSTSGASLRLVILDACRNNPLARSMQRTAATRSVSGGSFADLNEDLLGDETLVAYAAAAGMTAADGRGRNSPYTAALLSPLETPLEIGLLFRRIRAQVLAATNGGQRPHEYHSLVGEHYLTRTLATGTSVTVTAAAHPPQTDITELHIAALRELAEAGDAAAQTELGERYEEGRGGVVRDYEAAVASYRRAAEQGDARGQGNLGAMYTIGWGVPQDEEVAVRWFRRAVEQGNARAQNGLGIMYRDGRGDVLQDYTEAVRWFRLSAEQGYFRGQTNLGWMYANGRGVEQNNAEAVRWYRRAAEQRHALGQNNLVVRHAIIFGTDLRLRRAIVDESQHRTPERLVMAQHSAGCTGPVAVCLRTTVKPSVGSAVPPTRATPTPKSTSAPCTAPVAGWNGTTRKPSGGTAVPPSRGTTSPRTTSASCIGTVAGCLRTTRKPSDGTAGPPTREKARGQANLGLMYENGRGVRRDRVEAVRWYRRAADQGDSLAQEQLDRLR